MAAFESLAAFLWRALCLFLGLFSAGAQTSVNPASSGPPPQLMMPCLGNEGVWHQSIQVVVSNRADRPMVGEAQEVKIGKGENQADLEGMSADALRAISATGVELLWALRSPSGEMVRRGPIPAGSVLQLPVDCPALGQAVCYLLFDNPAAWAVPDMLEVGSGLRNGCLEEGTGEVPNGWDHDAADEGHEARWVAEQPRSGLRCLRTVVGEKAPPTWISTRQSHIRITGGARYLMRGWVRAAGVRGWAGWYIHVGNGQNPMLIGPMLNGGDGTYDWRELRVEFTAPPEANVADLGTVLRGTGSAWFDDVSLECVDSPLAKVMVRVSKPERLAEPREIGADAPWPAAAEKWDYRFPIHVSNASSQAATNGYVSADLSGAFARLNGRVDPERVMVMNGGKELEAFRLGALVLFHGPLEALTRRTFHAYFRAGGGRPAHEAKDRIAYASNPALPGGQGGVASSGSSLADYGRLLEQADNLASNPSFEAGLALPENWSGGEPSQRPAGMQMDCAEPGLFGRRCTRIFFPSNLRPQWVGWRQDARVQPGRTYLYSAWLKGKDIAGGLQLHAHFRNARGELCRDQQMTGAGPALNGTLDWTLLHGLFTMPADIATFQLHLTMQATGTAWHDGVLLMEITPGRVGRLQSRTANSLVRTTAWAVNPLVKVFQDDGPPAKSTPIRITAARNELEPIQIALRSPNALRHVRATVESPLGAQGNRLTNISVGVVGYVPVDHETSYYSATSPAWQRKVPKDPGRSDGWPGWWPDPILPRDTFDLPAHNTQPVWITVNVPSEAPPGDYAGKIRFAADGATLAEVPFTLHVWDFTLPETMHFKAIFDCRQDPRWWTVPGRTPEQSRRDFWRFMAAHRACPDTVQPSPSLRFDNGKVVADFAAFDAAAEYYFNTLKLPHAYTPWQFYCFGWGFPPSERFGQQPYEGTSPFAGADRSKLRPQFKRAYQACLKVYWDHLKSKGWDRQCVLYISDEPFDGEKDIRAQMKALCEMIHEVDPAILIYSSTWHHQPEWNGSLTVWGLGHYGIVPVERLRQILASGARIWWTTDGQMCIDTPYCAVERLLPHYAFKYGAEACEFWGVDWLTYDPYEYGWHSYIHQSDQPGKSYYVRYPNGDGYLAYPGSPIGHPGPVSSVRFEQVREGCEDYEYFCLLRDRITTAKELGRDPSAAAQTLQESLALVSIPNAGGLQSTRTLPNPDAVPEVKERVARAIESLRF